MAGSARARRLGGLPALPTFADADQGARLCEAIARGGADGRWAEVQ